MRETGRTPTALRYGFVALIAWLRAASVGHFSFDVTSSHPVRFSRRRTTTSAISSRSTMACTRYWELKLIAISLYLPRRANNPTGKRRDSGGSAWDRRLIAETTAELKATDPYQSSSRAAFLSGTLLERRRQRWICRER